MSSRASHPLPTRGPSTIAPEVIDALYDFALTVTWDPDRAAEAVRTGLRESDPGSADAADLFHRVRTEAVLLAPSPGDTRADINEELPPPSALPVPMLESIALGVLDGLEPTDRAALDLAMRRNLEGDDLAAALGVPPQLADGVVKAARERADRLLGHYVLARIGHDTCPRLREALDPEPEPLTRLADQVDAHLDECSLCTDRRFGLSPATGTLTAIPPRPAPRELVDALDHLWDVEEMEAEEAAERQRRWIILGSILVGVTVAGGLLAFWQIGSDDTTTTGDITETTLPQLLRASTQTIDFGAGAGSATVVVRNTAEEATAYTVTVDVPWVEVTPSEGTLRAGEQVELTVTLDRGAAPEGGRLVTTVKVASDVGVADVNIAASVPKGPEIAGVALDPTAVAPAGCDEVPTSATVSATASSGSPVQTAVVRWRGVVASGSEVSEGEIAMTQVEDRWEATLGPYGDTGTVTFVVSATDAAAKVVESPELTLQVNECPPSRR